MYDHLRSEKNVLASEAGESLGSRRSRAEGYSMHHNPRLSPYKPYLPWSPLLIDLRQRHAAAPRDDGVLVVGIRPIGRTRKEYMIFEVQPGPEGTEIWTLSKSIGSNHGAFVANLCEENFDIRIGQRCQGRVQPFDPPEEIDLKTWLLNEQDGRNSKIR